MKDHLTTRGVDFISINIVEDESGADDLRRLGVMTLPVVTRGERHAIGLDMDQVFDLIDIDETQPVLMPAGRLVERLGELVPAAVRFGDQLPVHHHHTTIPGRDRTYLGLANHVVAHVEIFLSLADGAALTLDGVDLDVLRGLERRVDDMAALRARATAALDETRRWWGRADDAELGRVVPTFFGDQTMHVLLGSTTYSVAQHTRQLQVVLEMVDVVPDQPLRPEVFDGLHMPKGVWE